MKKLTRLKLINWHRFSDVTIDFGDSTLISGENGAGKSTTINAILDLIHKDDGPAPQIILIRLPMRTARES